MSNRSASEMQTCPHCGNAVFEGAPTAPWCCAGCRLAQALLEETGLTRFYELREGIGVPVGAPQTHGALSITPAYEAARERARETHRGDGPLTVRLCLDLQGIHCAGCVWVLERLFRRHPGALEARVNPALGRIELVFEDAPFDLEAWASEVAALGYRVGPADAGDAQRSDDLLVRFGVTVALAMNSMILSLATYFGLAPADDAGLHRTFAAVNWGLSTLAVLIGGWVFFRGAIAAARRRVIHLDLPIALGIALAYLGATWSFFGANESVAYFDTLNVFIALMLLGRVLMRRIVDKNRRMLLADEGADGLYIRRLDPSGELKIVPAAAIEAGDELVLAPFELLPVNALLDGPGSLALEWITGEAEPQRFEPGDLVPAGAHNASGHALRLRATQPFAQGALRELLTPPASAEPDAADAAPSRFWGRVSALYVLGVLLVASVAFAAWLPSGLERALEVTVAILVVTCPCALGLATPLAYELALGRLRSLPGGGVYLRNTTFIDRALAIEKVVFDKTGTLTLGAPTLVDSAALTRLDPAAQDALFQLVSRSNHPKSRALYAALVDRGLTRPFDATLEAHETAGVGLCLSAGGHTWTLQASDDPDADVALLDGDTPLAHFSFDEQLRHDAARQLLALAERGVRVYVLSGDAQARVDRLVDELATQGVRPAAALGGLRPADKAAWVADLDDHDTLVLGDGLNDVLAFDAAFAAGTPATHHAALPARADFYHLGAGLGPVAETLDLARRTRRTIVRNLALALAYNALAVAVAAAGLMSPLLAAVLMPSISVVTVLHTTLSLMPRRPAARAQAPATRAAPTPTSAMGGLA